MEADRTGNTRGMSRLIKLVSGKSKSSMTTPSRDMQGNPILSQDRLLLAWNEFLSQKFASPNPDNDRLCEHTVSPHDTLINYELDEVLVSLKNSKAPGIDLIPIKAFNNPNPPKLNSSDSLG